MSYSKINDAEQQEFCGELLRSLLLAVRPGCDMLLFVVDYGDKGSISGCATYPGKARTLAAIQARLKRWETWSAPVLHDPAVHGWVPNRDELDAWHDWLKQRIEASGKRYGFMLFAGNTEHTQYVASVEREGAIGALKEFVKGTLGDMA